jgi:hypothetical protein
MYEYMYFLSFLFSFCGGVSGASKEASTAERQRKRKREREREKESGAEICESKGKLFKRMESARRDWGKPLFK